MFKEAIRILDDACVGDASGRSLVYGESLDWLGDPGHAAWDRYYRDNEAAIKAAELMKGCKVETVEQFGGEGQGDTIWAVYKVTLPDGSVEYYRCNGWYASYSGAEYQDTEQVYPKEVMKIEWSENP